MAIEVGVWGNFRVPEALDDMVRLLRAGKDVVSCSVVPESTPASPMTFCRSHCRESPETSARSGSPRCSTTRPTPTTGPPTKSSDSECLRNSLTGYVDGRPTFVVDHVTRMHDDIAPDWPQPGVAIAPQDLGYGGASGRGAYQVEIEGSPNIRCECDSRGDRRHGWCVARWPVHTGCDWSGTWMGVSSDDIDSLQADSGRSPATAPNPPKESGSTRLTDQGFRLGPRSVVPQRISGVPTA
jgi:hypothetical protein